MSTTSIADIEGIAEIFDPAQDVEWLRCNDQFTQEDLEFRRSFLMRRIRVGIAHALCAKAAGECARDLGLLDDVPGIIEAVLAADIDADRTNEEDQRITRIYTGLDTYRVNAIEERDAKLLFLAEHYALGDFADERQKFDLELFFHLRKIRGMD